MTRDDQELAFDNELTGLLMESYREAENHKTTDHVAAGRQMKSQMRRGRDLFARIKAYYMAQAAEKPNGHTPVKPAPDTKLTPTTRLEARR